MKIQTLRHGLALLSLPIFFMGVDRGCVTEPTIDTLTTASTIQVKGTLSEFDATGKFTRFNEGQVTLSRNGSSLGAQNTVSDVWAYPSVALSTGVNRFSGSTSRSASGVSVLGTIPEFIIERKTDLSNRGAQKVRLNWADSGIDNKLKAIATHTLEPAPSAAQLNQFVIDTKAFVKNFVVNAYQGYNIQVVDADGDDVHEIRLSGEDKCGLFGESPGDYKNQTKKQVSKVYVGSFKCSIVDDDVLLDDTPAKKTDSIAQRVIDVGTAIGRTSAHEFGHSLGLTAEGASKLNGCDGFHNCSAYDDANPSDRFDNGHYIMDPGPRSVWYARIGQSNETTRKSKPPKFNNYNKSYIKIIHP